MKRIVDPFAKSPLKSSAILNTENDDKLWFFWPILAEFHFCNNNHSKLVSKLKFRQYFNEINTEGLVFTKRLKCSDVHKFQKLNNLSIKILKLNFCQD